MSSKHLQRILCASQPAGSADAMAELLGIAEQTQAEAIALVGDLGTGAGGYREVFGTLSTASLPVYWVPGSGDAPADLYLRESYTIEVAFPLLRGVHGTAALAPDTGVVFAGMGGELSDDLDAPREERKRLRYPRWEPAYRLKVLALLDYNELVMLFATAPEHKGRSVPGSEAVAELVGTYRPRLVVCGGERGVALLGKSVVVAPGALQDGHYALADLRERTAELGQLSYTAPTP
jgi:Icc-related predicted phosphoesterase